MTEIIQISWKTISVKKVNWEDYISLISILNNV
jgi:hypothetical protein